MHSNNLKNNFHIMWMSILPACISVYVRIRHVRGANGGQEQTPNPVPWNGSYREL